MKTGSPRYRTVIDVLGHQLTEPHSQMVVFGESGARLFSQLSLQDLPDSVQQRLTIVADVVPASNFLDSDDGEEDEEELADLDRDEPWVKASAAVDEGASNVAGEIAMRARTYEDGRWSGKAAGAIPSSEIIAQIFDVSIAEASVITSTLSVELDRTVEIEALQRGLIDLSLDSSTSTDDSSDADLDDDEDPFAPGSIDEGMLFGGLLGSEDLSMVIVASYDGQTHPLLGALPPQLIDRIKGRVVWEMNSGAIFATITLRRDDGIDMLLFSQCQRPWLEQSRPLMAQGRSSNGYVKECGLDPFETALAVIQLELACGSLAEDAAPNA